MLHDLRVRTDISRKLHLPIVLKQGSVGLVRLQARARFGACAVGFDRFFPPPDVASGGVEQTKTKTMDLEAFGHGVGVYVSIGFLCVELHPNPSQEYVYCCVEALVRADLSCCLFQFRATTV